MRIRALTGLPGRLFVLSGCVFTLGMSEFMIAGLLGPMSAAFGTPEATTALLVTAFAAAVVVSAPITAALTLRLRPKVTLVCSMVVFIASHVLTALVADFEVALAARVAAGAACATFLTVGAVAAVRMVPPAGAPRAIASMVGGLTVSNVVGLPIAAWVGETFGWSLPFWLVAGLALIASLGLGGIRVDSLDAGADQVLSRWLRTEVSVLVRPSLLLTLVVVVLFQAAMFGTFTYLQPLLIRDAHLAESSTGPVMAVFGLGTLIGVALGGAVAQRGLLRNITASLAATVITLLMLLGSLGHSGIVIGAVVSLFGVATFSISAALNGRVFMLAEEAPTLASGVNISMLNLGNAAGPALTGLLIGAGHNNYRIAPWASIAFAIMALAVVGGCVRIDQHKKARSASSFAAGVRGTVGG